MILYCYEFVVLSVYAVFTVSSFLDCVWGFEKLPVVSLSFSQFGLLPVFLSHTIICDIVGYL